MTSNLDKELDKAINDYMSEIDMYVRDVNLLPEHAEKYKPGMIIMERGFTDASSRIGGMVTSHRFTILSNHMFDLSEHEHGTNRGLFVADHNGRFKVLDVYEYRDKTQILLLHLPDNHRWKLFKDAKISVNEIVEDCRKRFEKAFVREPVPELCSEEWLGRCASPLGIDDFGRFYDLELILENELKPVKTVGFREFNHRFVYVEGPDLLKRLMTDFLQDEDTGVIAYGYIDEQAGLSFHVVRIASLKDNQITIRDAIEKSAFIIRYGSLEEARFLDLFAVDMDFEPFLESFKEYGQMVRRVYDTKNPDKEKIRSFAFLDESRHPVYPDDFAVFLIHTDYPTEKVWVRGDRLTEGGMRGELLNEPYEDFGVHVGDSIQIIPYKLDDGSMICVSPQDV